MINVSKDVFASQGAQTIGVCYGMLGNNLPSASEVVALYKSNSITRMRIYNPNQATLDALRDTKMELVLGVPNKDLESLADPTGKPNNAESWIQKNVLHFWPRVQFRYIAVGNEVCPVKDPSLARCVLPALVNVFNAVRIAGLQDQIMVSMSICMGLLKKSYPPSSGAFRDDVRQFIDPIIWHLVCVNAPILANIFPYFSYAGNPKDISLPYALFTSKSVVVRDPHNGLGYQNIFDAMLDAMYCALERANGGSLEVVVSGTGWPSAGGFATSFDNARTYYSNLIRHVNEGTPKRPKRPIETYLFAVFDENQKTTPEREKNFGLFFPNGEKKYQLSF